MTRTRICILLGLGFVFANAELGFSQTVLFDDFVNPNPTDRNREPVRWAGSPGNLSIVDESLQIASSGDFSRAGPVGVSLESDVSIRTQVTTAQAGPFLQARFSPGVVGDTGYMAGITEDGSAFIGYTGTSARFIEMSDEIDFDPMQEEVLMQFDVIGDELSLYLWRPNELFPTDDPVIELTDNTISGPGQIRLGVGPPSPQAHSGSFRFVEVATQSIPRRVPGDFNSNGVLDAADIDLLSTAVRASDNDPAFDLNEDGLVDGVDRTVWVRDLNYTYFGDANLDGEFISTDFVAVLASGEYEDGIAANSGWATGDWDGDADATSADLIVALADGGYEQGPRAAVASVPEPSSVLLLLLGMLGVLRRLR